MLNAVKSADLAQEIRDEIENNEIQLPTLPEVALQVQRDTGAPQAAGGEAPVPPLSAGGFQDAMFH